SAGASCGPSGRPCPRSMPGSLRGRAASAPATSMPGSSPEVCAATSTARRQGRLGAALMLGAAFVALSLLWNLPVTWSGFGWRWLAGAAREVVVLLALLAPAAPWRAGRPGRVVAMLAALATTFVAVSKAAELAMRESLARPFNPMFDLPLARSLVDLLPDTLGVVPGWLSIAGLALLPLL